MCGWNRIRLYPQALLFAERNKLAGLKRLLEAGGAEVFSSATRYVHVYEFASHLHVITQYGSTAYLGMTWVGSGQFLHLENIWHGIMAKNQKNTIARLRKSWATH